MSDLVQKLLSEQAPSGAFYTTVLHKGKRFQDENGLVTCLVLRELSKLPGNTVIRSAIERGLDFIQSCAASEKPKTAFHFYPEGRQPEWLGRIQIPRADDTALAAITLVRHGLMSKEKAVSVADGLEISRLHNLPDGTFSWVQPGAYRTWLDDKMRPNRVDCVANANIATFLKVIGEDHRSGYAAAVETIRQGVTRMIKTPNSTALLSPYHPDPAELFYAIERAKEAGVDFGDLCMDTVAQLKPMRRNAGLMPVCSTVDKRTLWFSHGLQMARTIGRFHTPLVGQSA